MKTQQTKTIGAAICALLLSITMVTMLAGLGTNDAHAEDNTAIPSEAVTTNEPVGYYATGDNSRIDGLGAGGMAVSASYGYDTSGNLVSLAGLNIQGTSAYIAAEDLDSFRSSTALAIYSTPDASLGAHITWCTLYKTVTIEQPTVTEPTIPDKSETAVPEAKSDSKDPETDSNDAQPKPDVAPKEPVAPPTQTNDLAPERVGQPAPVSSESPILSLQCRKSEAEAKVAELESQGYEIVGIQEMPYWMR